MSMLQSAARAESHLLRVFLCHYSGDKPAVRELYHRLKANGFQPWLDEEDLVPGQNWQTEIPAAVRDSHVVVILLSRQSITREGYLQKEIAEALSVAQEKPERTIFIVPARLEEVEIPVHLAHWHWANLFEPDGYQRLVKALNIRASALGLPPNSGHVGAQGGEWQKVSAQAMVHPNVTTRIMSASEGYNTARQFVLRAQKRILSVVDWTVPQQPNPETLQGREQYYASLIAKVRESGVDYKRIIQLTHAGASTMKYNAPFISHLRECIKARDAAQAPARNIGIFLCNEKQNLLTFLLIDSHIVFIEFAEMVLRPNGDRCSQLDKVLMIEDSHGELANVFEKMFSNLMSYSRKMESRDIKRFEKVLIPE